MDPILVSNFSGQIWPLFFSQKLASLFLNLKKTAIWILCESPWLDFLAEEQSATGSQCEKFCFLWFRNQLGSGLFLEGLAPALTKGSF